MTVLRLLQMVCRKLVYSEGDVGVHGLNEV
jgi:hypothetical protein